MRPCRSFATNGVASCPHTSHSISVWTAAW